MDSTRWIKIKDLFMTAFDLPEPERTAFLATCDADLLPDVERLLSADIDAGEFINEPAAVNLGLAQEQTVDPYLGQQIDSYKIVKEIGHGGMGTVYLANHADESFDKQVALKLIKRGMDTNAVLKRFVMERRILAQLQHRFIANLLDGGSTSGGLPYFVMEHVAGLPITKFCDSNELSIDERLELFRKVCSAISYAHQNLVVHRDIKPSNIMVTEDGVPKLLDFGIAKLLHPDWSLDTNEATATMFRVLTPEYASPEQMRGAPITTTSDVYSLGVVLYELLCGERPFKLEGRMPDEAAQIVLTEEPIRPSSVVSSESKAQGSQKSKVLTDENNEPPATNNEQPANPKSKTQNLKSLRGDLDNIILKTLAKEPERRYQSVQELSEDIRRHLVGLPVTATADSMAYRMSKFVKRHRTAAIAGGAIVLILLAATAVTSWQARVARRERDRADQRFNQVRKLAHTVLFEYHDGIAKLAGSTPIRKKMVSDAIEYLDNLSAENIEDKDLLLELADAYEKVGDVQGNPYQANLGDQDGAVASYRKSLAIRETLFVSNPSDAGIKSSVGDSYNDVGDILWAKSASEEALANYNKALTIFEELSKAEPTVKNDQGIVYSLNGIAHVQAQMKDPARAIETYKRKLTIAEAILATEPENNAFRYAVAVSYLKLGDTFSEKGDYKTALEYQNKAIEFFSQMSEADKDDLTASRSLALALANTAQSYTELEQYQTAVEFNRKALKIQRQLAAVDQGNIRTQFDIANTLTNIGKEFMHLKQLDEAAKNLQESILIFRESFAKNPDYVQPRGFLANAYVNLGEVLFEKGDPKGAFESYQNALPILEIEPIRSQSPITLTEAYEGIGDVHQKAGRVQEAKTWFQKGVGILTELQRQGKLKHPDYIDELTKKIMKCDAVSAKAHG